ncbi:MAG: hypothetical protein WCC17_18835, partial [Candidatus Nitrosopolaris sp.]
MNEYKYKSYEELSQEFQKVYPAATRAFVLIPQMYNRLTLVDGLTHKEALAKIHNDHNHLPGFTERNIRRYLPANNPNIPKRVRTSRPKNSITESSERTFFSDTKHNDDPNIDHKFGRQSISNIVVDDISTDKLSETPDKIIQIEDATRRHVKSGLGEFSENQKLEEAQKETTTLPTSNTTLTAASYLLSSNISNKADLEDGKILNLEVSLPSRDMQRYITALRKKGKNEVWLTITINSSTGKVISVKTGRNSELETNSIHDNGV